MRLRRIAENQSRRSFLKKNMGVAASMSTGSLPGLAKAVLGGGSGKLGIQALGALYTNLSQHVQDEVGNFTFDLINLSPQDAAAFLDKYVEDGIVRYPDWKDLSINTFPLKAVLGRSLSYTNGRDNSSNEAEHLTASLLTGGFPDNFNLIQPNAISDILDVGIEKFGLQGIISAIEDSAISDFVSSETFSTWASAVSNPTLSKLFNMTPEMVKNVDTSGVGLRKMVDNGMISKEQATEFAGMQRDRRKETQEQEQQKEEKQREKERREKEQKELEKAESETLKSEVFNPSDDDFLASSMHQPFENRLNHALKLIS